MRFLGFSAATDDFTADVAARRCSHASAVNHVHTGAARLAHLREHAVRLMKRRERCGLGRRCDGQGEDNSDQPDHCLLLLIYMKGSFFDLNDPTAYHRRHPRRQPQPRQPQPA